MNILPHKSWHVRTKKNIERVRKDEEKAAEEEKERQRKISLAEQEARTSLLRNKAKVRAIEASSSSPLDAVQAPETTQSSLVPASNKKDVAIPGLGDKKEHINFFKHIEDGLVKQGKNKEYEAEKKKEQEELEKKIGLLTYLGQSALDAKESAPWYLEKKKKKKKKDRSASEESEEEGDNKIKMAMEMKRKESLDPLLEMKEYLHKKDKKHKKHKSKDKDKHSDKYRRPTSSKETKSSSKSSSSAPSSSTPSSSSSQGKKTIEQLRAERLARERQEKSRAQNLVKANKEGRRLSSDDSGEEEKAEEERRGGKRKYNSQYNPEYVRQPKKKYHERYPHNF